MLFASLLFCTCVGCNSNTQADEFLQQQPYAALTDSIEQQPKNAGLYYRRGALLLENNQLNYAESDLKKAWLLQQTETHALGAVSVLRRKNPDTAIVFIQKALQVLPQSIALKVSLARGYQQKKQYEESIAVCNSIIQQYPNQIDALLLKSELLQSLDRKDEALITLESAYAYAPFDAELAHQLAFEYAQAKNVKALTLSDSLISMDPTGKHAEPYYFKGVYYSNTGNNELALDFFNQAIQHDYYFLDAYMEKGRLLFDQKKYKPALETFELAVRVTPTFADAYYWQGKTKEAMGNKAEAKLDYQRAYSLDKTMIEARDAAERI